MSTAVTQDQLLLCSSASNSPVSGVRQTSPHDGVASQSQQTFNFASAPPIHHQQQHSPFEQLQQRPMASSSLYSTVASDGTPSAMPPSHFTQMAGNFGPMLASADGASGAASGSLQFASMPPPGSAPLVVGAGTSAGLHHAHAHQHLHTQGQGGNGASQGDAGGGGNRPPTSSDACQQIVHHLMCFHTVVLYT